MVRSASSTQTASMSWWRTTTPAARSLGPVRTTRASGRLGSIRSRCTTPAEASAQSDGPSGRRGKSASPKSGRLGAVSTTSVATSGRVGATGPGEAAPAIWAKGSITSSRVQRSVSVLTTSLRQGESWNLGGSW